MTNESDVSKGVKIDPFANSPKHNEKYGGAGGKGDEFPLLDPGQKAQDAESLGNERPIILDPCNEDDCALVAFQADGRPVIHPDFANDPVALDRTERSKIILNLDHPDFNSKREQLFHEIAADVRIFEELPIGAEGRAVIIARLESRLSANAPFSSAARYYMRLRHISRSCPGPRSRSFVLLKEDRPRSACTLRTMIFSGARWSGNSIGTPSAESVIPEIRIADRHARRSSSRLFIRIS